MEPDCHVLVSAHQLTCNMATSATSVRQTSVSQWCSLIQKATTRAAAHWKQTGMFLGAAIEGQRAAWVKTTPARRTRGGRHFAAQWSACLGALGNPGNRSQERLGVRMRGRLEQALGIPELHDLPHIHDCH